MLCGTCSTLHVSFFGLPTQNFSSGSLALRVPAFSLPGHDSRSFAPSTCEHMFPQSRLETSSLNINSPPPCDKTIFSQGSLSCGDCSASHSLPPKRDLHDASPGQAYLDTAVDLQGTHTCTWPTPCSRVQWACSPSASRSFLLNAIKSHAGSQ